MFKGNSPIPPAFAEDSKTISKEHFQGTGCHYSSISEGAWTHFPPSKKHNHWAAQLGIHSAQASKHFYESSGSKRCMSEQQIKHLKSDRSWVEIAVAGIYCAGKQPPVAGWKLTNLQKNSRDAQNLFFLLFLWCCRKRTHNPHLRLGLAFLMQKHPPFFLFWLRHLYITWSKVVSLCLQVI